MRLSIRLLLGYFFIVGVAAYFVLNVFVEEVKPGVSQAMEDTLVDTANLLAELATPDLLSGHLNDGPFAQHVAAYRARKVDALIWSFAKRDPAYRIYITDPHGRVIFDSEHKAIGKDFSRWRDVYLTLRGHYGARTTQETGKNPEDGVMYVAAPIIDHGQLLGVLTVGKPNRNVQPFIERSQTKVVRAGDWLLGVSLLIGLVVTLWFTRGVDRLVKYAEAVALGERVDLPPLSVQELRRLGAALEAMRTRLEGKQYVEQYISSLTHEMKSPLAAIQGAAELLDETLPPADRLQFHRNIREQSQRLRRLIDRMLALAGVEQRRRLDDPQALDLAALVRAAVADIATQAKARGVELQVQAPPALAYRGDELLLRQALGNLLDNALDFSPDGSCIVAELCPTESGSRLSVRDHGTGIPDYAVSRVFERFYSLPRPNGRPKSTGLGLSFVREVVALHGGSVHLDNAVDGGAVATILLPG